jgi:hypothetical protein
MDSWKIKMKSHAKVANVGRKGISNTKSFRKIKPQPCKCGSIPVVIEENCTIYLFCYRCETILELADVSHHADSIAINLIKKWNEK